MKTRVWIIPIVLVMALGLSGAALAAAGAGLPIPGTDSSRPQESLPPQVTHQNQGQPFAANSSSHPLPQPVATSRPPFSDLLAQARWASQHPQTASRPAGAESAAPSASGAGNSAFAQGSESVAPGFTVDMAYNAILGRITPGDRVTVSLAGGYGAAETDASGFFWTPLWRPDGQPFDLAGGEAIAIYVNGNLQATITPTVLSGEMDVLADQVSGTLASLGANVPVTVSLGVWGSVPSTGNPSESDLTAADGSFAVTFGDADLVPSEFAQVSYVAASSGLGEVVVRDYIQPEPVFLVQNRAAIAGYAPAGSVVTATVYEGSSPNVRWQGATAASTPLGFYNFSSGILNAPFAEIGDVVSVAFEDGTLLSTTVADLHDITFDASGDAVSGSAPNGATVMIYSWTQVGDLAVYREASTTAGAGGFNAALGFDLAPREWASVIVADAQGNTSEIFGGAPYINAQIDPFSEADCVWGRTDSPQTPITLSLHTSTGDYTRFSHPDTDAGNGIGSPWGTCLLVWQPGVWGPVNFAPGDVLTLASPTWSATLVVPDVNWNWDVANDSVWGEAPNGSVELNVSQWNASIYPDNGGITRLGTASSGGYSFDLEDFDLRQGSTLRLRYFAPGSDFATDVTGVQGYVLPYFEIHSGGVAGQPASPNEAVTATVYEADGTPVGSANWDDDGNPMWFWLNLNMTFWQPGRWITVTGESGWTTGMQIPEMDIQADIPGSQVWGEGPQATLVLRHNSGEWGKDTAVPGAGYVVDTAAYGRPLQVGDYVNIFYQDPNGNLAVRETGVGEIFRLEFWLNASGDTGVWGNAAPHSVVTLTTPGGQYTFPTDEFGDWNGNISPALQPGEGVTATAGTGQYPVIAGIPDPLDAQADSAIDQVWGQVGGWYTQSVQVRGNWPDGGQDVTTDASGNFLATFSDIPRGADGYIRMESNLGPTAIVYHRPFRTDDMVVQVNYAHDWVESQYEAGHSVWITLTNESGEVKATASGETGDIPWWGSGQTGFSTNHNVPWDGGQPDLQAGDWIYVNLDNSQYLEVHLGEIEGTLDTQANTVEGTIYVPWYTQTLNLNCNVWVNGGPGMGGITVDPQGGSYFCDFSPYDVLGGMDVAVQYQQPDGNTVINVFRGQAPRLEIQPWTNGSPASGNNYPFRVRYLNNGDALAADTAITLTLTGASYLGDSSGITPTLLGNTLVWEMGDLPASQSWQEFDLFLHVDALAGETMNVVGDIETATPYYQDDDWRKHFDWENAVQANNTHLNVGMGAWTWDPAPGYEFVYNINVCNNGDTASNATVLTATLHPSTTLVTWWGQYPGWEEIDSNSQQLVVDNLSIGAYQCGEVYVRALLSAEAWPGMELHASAAITSTSDLEPEDNQTEIWHNAGDPHTNLAIHQNWNWGELTPGGQLRYNLNFYNHGNLPVAGPFYVTDTLPVSTTFREAIEFGGGPQVAPYASGDGYVVWEIDGLDNGYSDGFEVVLDVDPQAIPGTALSNRAEITVLPGEDSESDNFSSWVETLYPHGPNVRVRQDYDWHGDYAGHAWYNLALENIGDVAVFNVLFTDTYPLPVQRDGGVDLDWGRLVDWQDHPGEHYFTATFQNLYPGDVTWINFNTSFGLNPVEEGLVLTNTAAIQAVEDETWTNDNEDKAILVTGPNLWVAKMLEAGEVRPGEVITFSLYFGNDQPGHTWWWNLEGNAILTDTLPDGLEFITSTQENCGPGGMWCAVYPQIEGNDYTWQLWPIHTGEWNRIRVVARLADDLTGLDELVNRAEIASDSPVLDIDPLANDNFSEWPLQVDLPYFEIAKTFEGSRVAGMPLTYTLTATNLGFGEGTTIQVIDPLPQGLTYQGGGNLAGGVVSWNLNALGPQGDSAEVQFWGTLQCQANSVVTNDAYQVAASDQGVTSAFGAPVTFTVQAPGITAEFEASALSILPGETVFFSATGTTDGTPLTFTWDFDDGHTASGPGASNTFATPGTYEVTLTATDGCGFTDTYTLSVTVAPHKLYLPLILRQYSQP